MKQTITILNIKSNGARNTGFSALRRQLRIMHPVFLITNLHVGFPLVDYDTIIMILILLKRSLIRTSRKNIYITFLNRNNIEKYRR